MTVYKDIVFKENQILIPNNLRTLMLEKLHTGHPGINKMKRRSKNAIYWLHIFKDIENFCKNCATCNKFRPNKQKSYLMLRKTPSLPWQEIGVDVFEYNKKYFIVIVDYLSNYIETEKITDLRSSTVIKQIKACFARYGIPVKVFTDGALYFNSKEFKNFADTWDFVHIMLSPHYPQSNGMAESAVKTVKNLLKKCEDSGGDPYLALLNLRNTPRDKINSPAQILFSRNLRTNIPAQYNTLIPKLSLAYDRKEIYKHKLRYKKAFDKTANKNVTSFKDGDNIWFKKKPERSWERGKIVSSAKEPRSYLVEDELGTCYRRNETHIHVQNENNANDLNSPTKNCKNENDPPQIYDNSNQQFLQQSPRSPNLIENKENDTGNYRTRFGRVVKKKQPFSPS